MSAPPTLCGLSSFGGLAPAGPEPVLPPTTAHPAVYTLYVFPFSIHSIYVRFGSILGAVAHGPLSDAPVLNVPVLTGPGLSAPLTSSLDMATWLCRVYPKLLPPEHRATIVRILSQLYTFEMVSLVTLAHDRFPVAQNRAGAIMDILQRDDLSAQHRWALECKLEWDDRRLSTALTTEVSDRARIRAREFLNQVLAQQRQYRATSARTTTSVSTGGGGWIFGDAVGPTILDAYAVPFVIHLMDYQMCDLIPIELQEWATLVCGRSPEWEMVMHGRRTLWSPLDDGPVEKFGEM